MAKISICDFRLVINAGGESRRMGQPKALLPVRGKALLAHMVAQLTPVIKTPPLIVINDAALLAQSHIETEFLAVPDHYPGMGSLGGIASGLAHCSQWAIMLACDLPFVNAELLAWMADLGSDDWDAIVPQVDGYAQPLHALYHRRCLPAIEARLAADERRVVSFLADVRVRVVTEAEARRWDPTLRSFYNVNTPADRAQALSWMEG